MENEVCVICLEKGNLFKKLYHLPCNCNYYIHKKCAKHINKKICLICKNNYLNKEEINIDIIDNNKKQIVYLNENENYKRKKYECCKFNCKYNFDSLAFYSHILLYITCIVHIIFFVGFVFLSIVSNEIIFFYDIFNFLIGIVITILFLWFLKPFCSDSDYD